jgi:hypothetical protein
MRPEKAYRLISNAIEAYLYKSNPSSFENATFLNAVDKLMSKLKLELGDSFDAYDEWNPTNKDYDGTQYEMSYISDRFNTPARLKWLRFGVLNNLFTIEALAEE